MQRRTYLARAALAFAPLLSLLALEDSASATTSTGVTMETVSDYTFATCGASCVGAGNTCGNGTCATACCQNNTNGNSEGSGFYYGPDSNDGLGFSLHYSFNAWYYDYHVWDTDFRDYNLTGMSGDSDGYFDTPGNAISLFIGHGFCDDITATACTSNSDCTHGYCPHGGSPLPTFAQTGYFTSHACIQHTPRSMQVSSQYSSRGNVNSYGAYDFGVGLPAKSMSFGGTYGTSTGNGTNIAILVNSCGFRLPYLEDETAYFFSGIHALLMTVPVQNTVHGVFTNPYADTSQMPNRGSYLAHLIITNWTAQMKEAWLDPYLAAQGFGFGLYGSEGDGNLNPDGVNMIYSRASSSTVSNLAVQETWQGAQNDANDILSSGTSAHSIFQCNWDCYNYPAW